METDFFENTSSNAELSSFGAHKASRGDMAQNSLPWVEKYRPTTLEEMISQEQITQTLNKLIDSGRVPHLLFYGPPGTGKTSSILAIARKLNGENYKSMTLELNASDDRTIQTVREKIKDFASTKKFYSKGHKLIILDEADAITNEAQAALRRIIEKYTKNTRFCLICNHINKIVPAIQSRCTKFRFGLLCQEKVKSRLLKIVEMEKVAITPCGMNAILRLAKGDMRRALNILQTAHMSCTDEIDEKAIYTCTGNPLPTDVKNAIDAMLNMDFETCHNLITGFKVENGYALQDIVTEVYELLMHTKLDNQSRITLFQGIADVEYRLACGCSENLQLSSLISTFIIIRDEMDKSIVST